MCLCVCVQGIRLVDVIKTIIKLGEEPQVGHQASYYVLSHHQDDYYHYAIKPSISLDKEPQGHSVRAAGGHWCLV